MSDVYRFLLLPLGIIGPLVSMVLDRPVSSSAGVHAEWSMECRLGDLTVGRLLDCFEPFWTGCLRQHVPSYWLLDSHGSYVACRVHQCVGIATRNCRCLTQGTLRRRRALRSIGPAGTVSLYFY